jgi:2,3-bisphosphoglycerate-dependent phosphoglycerate mutase
MIAMLRRSVLALALLGPAASVAAQDAPLTVFVVRHAEKGPDNPDPSLTEAGQRRAVALARTLTDAPVGVLFASEFKRTQETLGPLARANGLTVTVVPAGRMDSLIAKLKALPPGSRAAVASHSNLVHLIVQRLSGQKIPELTEADYDRIAVVTLYPDGRSQAVVLRYGEP